MNKRVESSDDQVDQVAHVNEDVAGGVDFEDYGRIGVGDGIGGRNHS